MPKMKTKSGLKKRFRVTATGKIKMTQAGKRHGMRKRSRSMKRKARGTEVMQTPGMKALRTIAPYLKYLD
jgi:large subunit ribosomal protein L35